MLSFEEKNTQPWFTYFQITGKYLNYVKTNPLYIIVDDFSIYLLGYSEFRCLYLPQEHTFISTVLL